MDYKFDNKGLIPAIVQDSKTKEVLMLGYMNRAAIELTLKTKKVTFYSRSKDRLWVKGETSDNLLNFQSMKNDCDNDALLIQATPSGPVCHEGTQTCWGEVEEDTVTYLERSISERKNNPSKDSYVSSLFESGVNKIAQKVGEEAIEVVIEAKDDNQSLFLNEAADLFFHYLILLQAKNTDFQDVLDVLDSRKKMSLICQK